MYEEKIEKQKKRLNWSDLSYQLAKVSYISISSFLVSYVNNSCSQPLIERIMLEKKKNKNSRTTPPFSILSFSSIRLDSVAGPILADVRVCVARVRVQ